LRGEDGGSMFDINSPDGLFETIEREKLLGHVQDDESQFDARTEQPQHVAVGKRYVRSD
jgi:hypothetical protein